MEGQDIAFISGGNLSKASYNKLNAYREKLSKNYDTRKKKIIREFVFNLSKGNFKESELVEIMRTLNLIKNGIDEFDYSDRPHYKDFERFNLLQQFIQRNMSSMRLLKQLYKGRYSINQS